MTTTTTSISLVRLAPVSGTPNQGWKLGYVEGGAFAAQGDKWLIKNAKEVKWAVATVDADGVLNPVSDITGATITLNGTTATATSAIVIYR